MKDWEAVEFVEQEEGEEGWIWRLKPEKPDGATIASWGIVVPDWMGQPHQFLHETTPFVDGEYSVQLVREPRRGEKVAGEGCNLQMISIS